MASAVTATRALAWGALAGLSALAAIAVPAHAAGKAGGKAKKPNVVVIVSDDQAVQTVRQDTMPNLLGRIAASGTTFDNAIATTPLCCPSRAGMLTGQYGHNNGVLRNDYRQLSEKSNTLPVWLDRAGYRTIHVGKYLNLYRRAKGPEAEPAPGWDVWQTIQEPNTYYDYDLSVNGRKVHYGDADRDYLTDVLNRKATRLVRRSAPGKRPFYLQLDHWAPHDSRGRGTGPCHGGDDPVPAPTDENLFANEPFPAPPSFNEEDLDDKPSFVQRQNPVDVGVVERSYRCALASLRAVDRGIGKIHTALKKAGELRRTVIVYVGDNGLLYGEHRLRFKIPPYEEALRVPLIVSVPPSVRGGAPRAASVPEPVANIDLAPTILELAGAAPCRRRGDCRVMDGRSLLPLLQGEQSQWPQDRVLAVEYTGRHHGFSSCSYRGVRAPGQLYVEHTLIPNFQTGECEPKLEVEHYDLDSDPFELQNLYPALPLTPQAALQEDLAERLERLRDCAGIAGRDPVTPGREHCE
ncbi:MAG: sulfatase family protein [Solirubrobacterales bacterium]